MSDGFCESCGDELLEATVCLPCQKEKADAVEAAKLEMDCLTCERKFKLDPVEHTEQEWLHCPRCLETKARKAQPKAKPAKPAPSAKLVHDGGFDAYIGRGSMLHRAGRSFADYKKWLWNMWLNEPSFQRLMDKLSHKTLGCHCTKSPCHGEAIIALINYIPTHRQKQIEQADAKIKARQLALFDASSAPIRASFKEIKKAWRKPLPELEGQFLLECPNLNCEAFPLRVPVYKENAAGKWIISEVIENAFYDAASGDLFPQCPRCDLIVNNPLKADKFEGEDMEMVTRRDAGSPYDNAVLAFSDETQDHEEGGHGARRQFDTPLDKADLSTGFMITRTSVRAQPKKPPTHRFVHKGNGFWGHEPIA